MSKTTVIHDREALSPYAGAVLVPTMGALHEGHLSLIRAARGLGGPVVASVFVNPTQFAPGEDFDAYPRNLDRDVALAAEAGCDAIYAPSARTMYPEGPAAAVEAAAGVDLPDVARTPALEDGDRPRFFGGVCLVVARLLRHVRPTHAVFGEKDWQQLQVVRAMVRDTPDLRHVVVGSCPTVREPDGIAMSSRNERIPSTERGRALGLVKALQVAQAAQHPGTAEQLMTETLLAHDLEIDYAVVRHPETLAPVADLTAPTRGLVAARLRWADGDVRLIDNRAMTVWP